MFTVLLPAISQSIADATTSSQDRAEAEAWIAVLQPVCQELGELLIEAATDGDEKLVHAL